MPYIYCILLGHPEVYKLTYIVLFHTILVHSDTVKKLSRAVATNLPSSQSLELLKTLGISDGGSDKPNHIPEEDPGPNEGARKLLY